MGKGRPIKVKRRRHTPEQIIRKLREAERMLAEGKTTAAAAKALEVSENTFHRWRNQYGGMKADDAKELKELRRENATLKRIVADKELENVALKDIARLPTTRHCGASCEGSRARSRCGATAAPMPVSFEEGWSVSRKRVQRLWRSEGLRVPQRKRKRARRGDNADGKRLRRTCG